jgi:hypothetical protein
MDSGGSPEGVEARHLEAWASEPADLERHWLGEIKDASEELLRTVPGAGRGGRSTSTAWSVRRGSGGAGVPAW